MPDAEHESNAVPEDQGGPGSQMTEAESAACRETIAEMEDMVICDWCHKPAHAPSDDDDYDDPPCTCVVDKRY